MSDIKMQAEDRHIEMLEPEPEKVQRVEPAANLSDAHRDYLVSKHGTAELDPLPDMTDLDPLNWPTKTKVTNLVLVSFHGMMATFTAAAIQSSFEPIAVDLNVSLHRASYMTSLVIAVIGGAPLVWRPLADRFGRRPIFLLSLLVSCVGNIGCAKSPSYATMGLCRAITAFFICPAAAVGSGVVAESFFKEDRARYLGLWTLMVTLGVPVAPLVFGFVSGRVGYRWIYWILAITNVVQLILYGILGKETRYIRGSSSRDVPANTPSMWRFSRIDHTPLTLKDFIQPLSLAARPRIMIPTASYAMIFLWQIMIAIEIPQVFVVKFHLNAGTVGLQNIAIIVGSLIGEQLGGSLSDWWMKQRQKRTKSRPEPEFRLWLSYVGYLLTIVGVTVFLVQTNAAKTWNVTPLIGAAISSVGNQLVTTVLITYAVDSHTDQAAGIGVFVNFVRQTWGFIGPFWFPLMLENVGFNLSSVIVAVLIVTVCAIPTALLQWRAR